MENQQIHETADRVKEYLTGGNISDTKYALLVADAFRALIFASDKLKEIK